MSHFLGQNLSERWWTKGSPDPLKARTWAALRYLTMIVFVILTAVLFSRSPGGAFLLGIGGALAVSMLLNVLLLPRDERPTRDVVLLAAGGVAAVIGIYLLATSS